MRHALSLAIVVALLISLLPLAACVSVKAPEEIRINDRPARVDSSSVPPTASHEEARQLLADAYARNQYLEAKVDDLEADKDELKRERDEYKKKYKRLKDRYED